MTDTSSLRIRTPRSSETKIPTPPMTRSETRAHLMRGLENWLFDELVPLTSDELNNTIDVRCLRRVAEWKGVDMTAAAHFVFAVVQEYLETGVFQKTPADKLAVGFATVCVQPFGRPIAELWKVSPFEKLRNAPPLPGDEVDNEGDEVDNEGDEEEEDAESEASASEASASGNEDISQSSDTDTSQSSDDNDAAVCVKSKIQIADMAFETKCSMHTSCIASLAVLVIAYLWSVAALVSRCDGCLRSSGSAGGQGGGI